MIVFSFGSFKYKYFKESFQYFLNLNSIISLKIFYIIKRLIENFKYRFALLLEVMGIMIMKLILLHISI